MPDILPQSKYDILLIFSHLTKISLFDRGKMNRALSASQPARSVSHYPLSVEFNFLYPICRVISVVLAAPSQTTAKESWTQFAGNGGTNSRSSPLNPHLHPSPRLPSLPRPQDMLKANNITSLAALRLNHHTLEINNHPPSPLPRSPPPHAT